MVPGTERRLARRAVAPRGSGQGHPAEALWPEERARVEEARRRLTAGDIRLAPHVAGRGTLARRWRLWVNATVAS